LKFALATGIGFLIAEAILVMGLIFFYNTTKIPSETYSSFTILGLNALAFGLGVTIAFVINERVTVSGESEQRSGLVSWFGRWGKYQLASLLGNVITVLIQLVLLAAMSLSPVFGNIIGAVVSYPLTYIVSMRFVWKIHLLGRRSKESKNNTDR
jgi:putative flippase GtrA